MRAHDAVIPLMGNDRSELLLFRLREISEKRSIPPLEMSSRFEEIARELGLRAQSERQSLRKALSLLVEEAEKEAHAARVTRSFR